MNSYFTYVISTVTALVACSTFVVGYSQAKIASAKVKLDLYERRFNVYVTALKYCQEIHLLDISHLETDKHMFLELVKSSREAMFLFKKEDGIDEILTEIKERGEELVSYRNYPREEKSLSSMNPYINAYTNQHDFTKSLEDLEEKIKPYIQFKTIQGWTFF